MRVTFVLIAFLGLANGLKRILRKNLKNCKNLIKMEKLEHINKKKDLYQDFQEELTNLGRK